MKRILLLALTALLSLSLTACGGAPAPDASDAPALLQQAATQTPVPSDGGDAAAAQADLSSADADVDLTKLSSTLVYSEVFNMVNTPEDYVGKVVKMSGAFAVYEDETTGNVYFACINQDATACCSQGIEFVPQGDFTYPDDFPELGTEITVRGTFGTYMEGDQLYVTLYDAEMSV